MNSLRDLGLKLGVATASTKRQVREGSITLGLRGALRQAKGRTLDSNELAVLADLYQGYQERSLDRPELDAWAARHGYASQLGQIKQRVYGEG